MVFETLESLQKQNKKNDALKLKTFKAIGKTAKALRKPK